MVSKAMPVAGEGTFFGGERSVLVPMGPGQIGSWDKDLGGK